MPLLSFPLEIKSLSSEGVFEGLASTYGGPPDLGGDICEPGCFTETLKQAGSERTLLADHREPIGVVTIRDTAAGLAVKGRLTLAVQKAAEVYALMKDGAVRGLSIGYSVVGDKGSELKNGVRYLRRLKLYEISTTWAPMNEFAMVTGVKSRHELQIKSALDEFRSAILNAFSEG